MSAQATTNSAFYLDAMGIEQWVSRDVFVQDSSPEQTQSDQIATADWSSLQAQVSQCQRCALHQGRHKTVFGAGNQQVDWMIIGEAPGFDEDLQGEPFVGRAGELLNAMLFSFGLQREQVFIANVLKCRPPQNRDPEPSEIAQCGPYLDRQIALLKPRLLLVLGRVAAHHILQTNSSLRDLRGRCHEYNGIPLIVTYHPAYLLRRPSEKVQSWLDLQLAYRTVPLQKTVSPNI